MARLQTSSAALTGIILISRIVSFDPTGPTKHLALQPDVAGHLTLHRIVTEHGQH